MSKKIITILVLLMFTWVGKAGAVSGRLGEFGVGDSIDVPYHVLNCSGSKRAVSADSVTYSIYKDTLDHYAMPVDSGKVTATTAPSFAVSAGRGFVNYFLRVCANAGNHAPGRYTALIEAWDDTCSQMHNVWWDCYADSTTHDYAKNNRLIAEAVKAKTDSSSFSVGGLIKSTPQTDVTVDGASVGSIAGATWASATRKLTHLSEHDVIIHIDSTLQIVGVKVVSADADAFGAPAFADNAQYMVYGGAVWVDTVNGTAGTVVGVNGLPSLPCRGFEKAKIIADLIGVTTFCLRGGGDQSIKETVNGYTFIGTGDPTRNQIDLNSEDVGGCMFVDLDITGIQGGDRATYVRCALEDVSIDAAAIQCFLRGDITLLGDQDNIFAACFSSVPGTKTPKLIFSGGSESAHFRGYSGGLELDGMGANDTISFEAIGGQLIIAANCNVNSNIVTRGMITVTDNTGGLNKLTYVATAQYAVDSTMNAIHDDNKANFKATGFAVSGDPMTLQSDSLYETLMKIDSLIYTLGYDDDSTVLVFLRYIRNNQADYKATGYAVVGDVMTLQSDTLYEAMMKIDSLIHTLGYDADSTVLAFLQYIRNNQADYKATGFAVSGDPMTLQSDSLYEVLMKIDSLVHTLGYDNDSTVLTFLRYIRNNQADYRADVSGLSTHDAADVWNVDTSGAWNDDLTKFGEWNAQAQVGAGGGGGATAQEVWEYDLAGEHFDGDSTQAGDYMRIAAACGSGTGDNTTIIYVLNAADSTTRISGFDITIQDSASGEYRAYGRTNTSGVDTFSLPDGTFKISMSKTTWSINTPVYKSTAGDSTWTFYATAYDPGSPPSAAKCNVWTLISDLSASWLAGCRLTVWVPSKYFPLTFDTTLVSPYTVDAVSNDTGLVVVTVYRSAELTTGNGQTVKMYIEARAPNGDLLGRTFKEIPNQGSWEVIW